MADTDPICAPGELPPSRTLGEVLSHWAARQPDHLLLIAPETGLTLSYGELATFTGRLDRWYSAQGVGRGDKVAIYMTNGMAMGALFLATMACGRVITPLNLLSQGAQLLYVLDHCDARLLFTSAEHLPAVTRALGGADARFATVVINPDAIDLPPAPGGVGAGAAGGGTATVGAAGQAAATAAVAAAAPDDVALMMYTSGTTGKPKGTLLSHANLLYAANNVARWHSFGPADRVLSALPLYHINGQVIATVTPFLAGGSIVAPRKFSVSTWWEMVATHRCTWLNMVPTIIAYLLNAADSPQAVADARAACRSVRFGRSASAPLPPEHHREFEARFGVTVIEAMGMTESSSVVFCNPMPPALRKYGTPGKPVGIIAKVVDATGNEVADGVQGEIWFRGANVMVGYYKSPEQTAGALTPDGWLRTGDLGHRDADGFYFITGRLKELIIKGGENIAPREIDEALLRHPAVLEAAVVGIPHPAYGQDILACVVLRDGEKLTEQALAEFCKSEIGAYKTPSQWRFVQELPKGPSGKIQRMKLLETL